MCDAWREARGVLPTPAVATGAVPSPGRATWRRGVVAAQHEIASNNARLAHPSEARAAASSLVRPQPTSAPLVGPPIEALTNRVEGRWFSLEGLRVSGFGFRCERVQVLVPAALVPPPLAWPGACFPGGVMALSLCLPFHRTGCASTCLQGCGNETSGGR